MPYYRMIEIVIHCVTQKSELQLARHTRAGRAGGGASGEGRRRELRGARGGMKAARGEVRCMSAD